MTDFLLLEKVYRMIAGVSKPRLLYKKGIYMKGFFSPYMSMGEFTTSEVFSNINGTMPVTVRFSSMLGDIGTSDTRRNIKSMAVKIHGEFEEHDIISQNLPVFFINNEKKIEDLACAFTYRTAFDRINSIKLWQMVADNPEAVNCIMHLFSYEGVSDSFVSSKWYCVYTYIWKGKNKDKVLVRYRWVPVSDNGEYSSIQERKMSRTSAEFMAGFNPDIAYEQLDNNVKEGRFPAFELQVQMMDYKHITHPDFTKPTLCWNDNIYKPVTVGIMKLTEVSGWGENDKEKTCFALGNVPEGIELYRDGFSEMIDYICRISAVERGAAE